MALSCSGGCPLTFRDLACDAERLARAVGEGRIAGNFLSVRDRPRSPRLARRRRSGRARRPRPTRRPRWRRRGCRSDRPRTPVSAGSNGSCSRWRSDRPAKVSGTYRRDRSGRLCCRSLTNTNAPGGLGERVVRGDSQTKATALHLTTDAFFALLPLLVMGLVWPPDGAHHPSSFWLGPEISMTSCVLYGLGLSKLFQGSVVVSVREGRPARDHIRQIAAVHMILSLIPMMGIILSIIAINRTLTPSAGFGWHAFQYVNLLFAAVTFFVVGGYGLKRAESED